MFYLIMRVLKKIHVAIGSRTMEYYVDYDCGEVEFNIWRKRLTYAWHLQNDMMTFNTMDFAEHTCGYEYDEVMLVESDPHRSWTKGNKQKLIKQGYKVGRLKRIAMIMYLYRLVRFPFNYIYTFFINLEVVEPKDMFDSNV